MNPYTPPTSDVSKHPQKPWSSSKAILIGIVIDVGGTVIVGSLIGIVYWIVLTMSGMTMDQAGEAMAAMPKFSLLSMLGAVTGLGFSVLSGFVATRKAQRSDFRLGMILGAISTLIGFALFFEPETLAIDLAFAALGYAAVMVGTYLGRVKTSA